MTSFTTSDRRGFERDVQDYARALGLSKLEARVEVTRARDFCGELQYNSDDSAWANELDDSKDVLERLSSLSITATRSAGSDMSGELQATRENEHSRDDPDAFEHTHPFRSAKAWKRDRHRDQAASEQTIGIASPGADIPEFLASAKMEKRRFGSGEQGDKHIPDKRKRQKKRAEIGERQFAIKRSEHVDISDPTTILQDPSNCKTASITLETTTSRGSRSSKISTSPGFDGQPARNSKSLIHRKNEEGSKITVYYDANKNAKTRSKATVRKRRVAVAAEGSTDHQTVQADLLNPTMTEYANAKAPQPLEPRVDTEKEASFQLPVSVAACINAKERKRRERMAKMDKSHMESDAPLKASLGTVYDNFVTEGHLADDSKKIDGDAQLKVQTSGAFESDIEPLFGGQEQARLALGPGELGPVLAELEVLNPPENVSSNPSTIAQQNKPPEKQPEQQTPDPIAVGLIFPLKECTTMSVQNVEHKEPFKILGMANVPEFAMGFWPPMIQ